MQDDQSAPLGPDEVAEQIHPRRAIADPPAVPLRTGVTMAVAGTPQSEVFAVGAAADQLRVEVQGAAIGVHVFPPPITATEFRPEEHTADREAMAEGDGYFPDHLALRTTPEPLPQELRVPRRTDAVSPPIEDLSRDVHMPTTIFGTDDRHVFLDTAYPWSTIGRVETPGDVSTGVMVGPRHMLMCSHAMQWNAGGTASGVKFKPSYFDGSTPFGVATGIKVYWEGVKVVGTINAEEGRHDYVVVVLDWRIGDLTGWMNRKTWADSWDGVPRWTHVGYPVDVAAGRRPTYQMGIAGTSLDNPTHTRINHFGDVCPGQSGGPFFGWWSGSSVPSVVAVQSGQTSAVNSASGGGHMVGLITQARIDFP
jgi:V8-like Glu-specific endopeptidase